MPRPGETGLTLVETLVVLAIIGVMAGATVLAIGAGNRGAGVEAEARRLAARLRLAADETMVTDRSLAFVAQPHGYAFVAWDADKRRWLADRADALQAHELPSAITLATDGPARPLPIGADSAGGPITVRLAAADRIWIVKFDGTDAVAAAARP